MELTSGVFYSLAATLNLLAMISLWLTWRSNRAHKNALRLGCWALMMFSLWYWIHLSGVEFGFVFWFINSALSAMITIAINSWRQDTHPSKQSRRTEQTEKPSTLKVIPVQLVGQRVVTFLIAGPLALIGCMALCLFLVKVIPMTFANSLVLAAFLLPLVWALWSSWLLSQSKRLVPSLSMIIVIALSATLLYAI